MTDPYCPSNGTEGEMFMEAFCNRCRFQGEGDLTCFIMLSTIYTDISHKDYPKEWQYDETGLPCCTEYEPEE